MREDFINIKYNKHNKLIRSETFMFPWNVSKFQRFDRIRKAFRPRLILKQNQLHSLKIFVSFCRDCLPNSLTIEHFVNIFFNSFYCSRLSCWCADSLKFHSTKTFLSIFFIACQIVYIDWSADIQWLFFYG